MDTTSQTADFDVAILGAGLAGLTLALQITQDDPALRVALIERKPLPHPPMAHKVGESTVEIGAHYLSSVLGLKDHLDEAHLRKFGLRCFFNEAAGHSGIENAAEIGGSSYLAHRSYQIDRAVLENHMAQLLTEERGAVIIPAARVREIDLAEASPRDPAPHSVRYASGGQDAQLIARWVVDASGRNGTLKRQLGLQKANPHVGHAAWYRLPTRIDINDWSDNAQWLDRVGDHGRLLSTVHMMGTGYWMWIIPLACGHTSIGVVADPTVHAVGDFKSVGEMQHWLRAHEPQLAEVLEPHLADATDFRKLRDYSYDCAQLFSAQRWALTGEAGLFLDPFYSPGTDFIGISNTYIADLIARDRRGERLAGRAAIYNDLYQSFYNSTLVLYQDQMPLFGDPRLMKAKITWDFFYYWAVLALIFCQERLTDVAWLGQHRERLLALRLLNRDIQALFRRWGEAEKAAPSGPIGPAFLDQLKLPWMLVLNKGLTDELTTEQLSQRLIENAEQLTAYAGEVARLARSLHPELETDGIDFDPALPPAELTPHWDVLVGRQAA